MTLYAETSAVASWLLGEARGAVALEALRSAGRVFCSELTLIECDRTVRSAQAIGRLRSAAADAARRRLKTETASWAIYGLGAEVGERARREFPVEPVRTLDALHLATVLLIDGFRPDLKVLSFHRRVRANAAALGFDLLPSGL